MERAVAYRRKLNVIVDALGKIPASGKHAGSLSALEREGVLHLVQVSVDAALDLAAMLVKDAGEAPSDDYHNLEMLVKQNILPASLGEGLRKLNGLRNAIVHKYNSFEEARLFTSLEDIRLTLQTYAELVEGQE
jgi:uncharacterized protein YutE (UPF0331/DUF86 family)